MSSTLWRPSPRGRLLSDRIMFGSKVLSNQIWVSGGASESNTLDPIEYLEFQSLEKNSNDNTNSSNNNNNDIESVCFFGNLLEFLAFYCVTFADAHLNHGVTQVGQCFVVVRGIVYWEFRGIVLVSVEVVNLCISASALEDAVFEEATGWLNRGIHSEKES